MYHDETRVTKGALTFKRGRKQVYFGKRLSTEQAADILRAFGARSGIAFST